MKFSNSNVVTLLGVLLLFCTNKFWRIIFTTHKMKLVTYFLSHHLFLCIVISFQDTKQGNYIAVGKLQITFISNCTLLFDLNRKEREESHHKLIRRKDSWFDNLVPKINNCNNGSTCFKSSQCKSGFCNNAECKGDRSQKVRYFSFSPHEVDC